MMPGVNIINRKARVVRVNRAMQSGEGTLNPSAGVFEALRKFLDSKDHLNWLPIVFNVAEIITLQNYKCKKKLM